MTTRTPPPFDRVVPVSALREGETLSSGTGQSRKVCTLANHPGWLIKEYWSEMPASEVERLDRLIGLPASMGPPERALVETSTSWPVAIVNAPTATSTRPPNRSSSRPTGTCSAAYTSSCSTTKPERAAGPAWKRWAASSPATPNDVRCITPTM